MKKLPEDRFASAADMRVELQRAVDGHFDVVCPTTFSRRVFRLGMDSANRRPVLMLGTMLAVVTLSGYGAMRFLFDWL